MENGITVISAVSENGYVGLDNGMLWTKEQVPKDLPHFFRQTLNGALIYGRKTFESMGSNPLSKRVNIIISKTLEQKEGFYVFSNYTQGREFAQSLQTKSPTPFPIFAAGGYEIWKEALLCNFTTRALITRVHYPFEGDTRFPEEELQKAFVPVYADNWKEKKEEGKFSSTFEVWLRKK